VSGLRTDRKIAIFGCLDRQASQPVSLRISLIPISGHVSRRLVRRSLGAGGSPLSRRSVAKAGHSTFVIPAHLDYPRRLVTAPGLSAWERRPSPHARVTLPVDLGHFARLNIDFEWAVLADSRFLSSHRNFVVSRRQRSPKASLIICGK
jgi:hypothetical protein